jgi:hypothetical protein
MQDKDLARQRVVRRLDGAAWRRARLVGGFLAVAALAGCSSIGGDPLTVFADPGKYQYHTCEQIAGQRKNWTSREQELKMLMDKAGQSAGGSVVNVLAYRADYVTASEELKVLENTARAKNCDRPENWKSNSGVK